MPLKHRSPDADTKRIMKALDGSVAAGEPGAHVSRPPTELAAASPKGYQGTREREADRRPGVD